MSTTQFATPEMKALLTGHAVLLHGTKLYIKKDELLGELVSTIICNEDIIAAIPVEFFRKRNYAGITDELLDLLKDVNKLHLLSGLLLFIEEDRSELEYFLDGLMNHYHVGTITLEAEDEDDAEYHVLDLTKESPEFS